MEFIKKGTNPKVYEAAASEYEIDIFIKGMEISIIITFSAIFRLIHDLPVVSGRGNLSTWQFEILFLRHFVCHIAARS